MNEIDDQGIARAMLLEWDPIGVADIPEASDEYDNYASPLLRLLQTDRREQTIFEYLWWLETEQIGLPGNEKATREFARSLLARMP